MTLKHVTVAITSTARFGLVLDNAPKKALQGEGMEVGMTDGAK